MGILRRRKPRAPGRPPPRQPSRPRSRTTAETPGGRPASAASALAPHNPTHDGRSLRRPPGLPRIRPRAVQFPTRTRLPRPPSPHTIPCPPACRQQPWTSNLPPPPLRERGTSTAAQRRVCVGGWCFAGRVKVGGWGGRRDKRCRHFSEGVSLRLCFHFSKSNWGMMRFHFFCFPFLSKSHRSRSLSVATATYFHGGLRYRQAVTASLGGACNNQGHSGQRLKGPRARWVAPGRTKGAMGDAREDPGCAGRLPGGPSASRPTPERTNGALGGAQEDQGLVGWHQGGPRSRGAVPGRAKPRARWAKDIWVSTIPDRGSRLGPLLFCGM